MAKKGAKKIDPIRIASWKSGAMSRLIRGERHATIKRGESHGPNQGEAKAAVRKSRRQRA